jgi:hypothetical protein
MFDTGNICSSVQPPQLFDRGVDPGIDLRCFADVDLGPKMSLSRKLFHGKVDLCLINVTDTQDGSAFGK